MLNTRRFFGLIVLLALLLAACTSASPIDSTVNPPPSTVAAADAESAGGVQAVNIGMILNSAAPTASRDLRLAEVMTTSAVALSDREPIAMRVETVTIDDVLDVGSAIDELASRGVTVIATSCDDSSMGAVVDAALEQGLLAVTGCVAIPKPDLSTTNELFIDLASLDDSGSAIAGWLAHEELVNVAILGSALIPDVEQTCLDIEVAADLAELEIVARGEFVELVDQPDEIVASISDQLVAADAIAICALPPALGELTSALRDAGHEQTIVVPWFGETQGWPDSLSNAFVFTPSSRHGDDPAPAVLDLYETITEPEAVDVVTADTLAVIAAAASDANTAGSSRIASTVRDSTRQGLSGDLSIELGREDQSVIRTYRVLEVTNGEVEFLTTANAN